MANCTTAEVISVDFQDLGVADAETHISKGEIDTKFGDRRRFFRWRVSWPATLFYGEQVHNCSVHDFSEGGAQINMARIPPIGSKVQLKFPFTVFLKGEVVWRRDGYFGIEFDRSVHRSARVVQEFLLERSVAN